MIRLNKPNIKGTKDSEKIEEMRRYLFSLVDDLQFAIQALENEVRSLKGNVASMSIATTEYDLATPDAVAFDGMAYEGDMPVIEEEIVEEGENEDERISEET